jgi:hypothetical protein
MKHVHVLALALVGAAVGACASEGQTLAAIRSCEAVGITLSDPYFETCTQAYRLQSNQDNLDSAFHLTLNPTYEKRGLAHQWHGF